MSKRKIENNIAFNRQMPVSNASKFFYCNIMFLESANKAYMCLLGPDAGVIASPSSETYFPPSCGTTENERWNLKRGQKLLVW